MSRKEQLEIAFKQFDEEKKGTLSFNEVQKLLISFGVRPAEQSLGSHMPKDQRVSLDRVGVILDTVDPLEAVRHRLLRALSSEDAREERARRMVSTKNQVDGLISHAHVSNLLLQFGLTQIEIDDAVEHYRTADNQIDYESFVFAMTEC